MSTELTLPHQRLQHYTETAVKKNRLYKTKIKILSIWQYIYGAANEQNLIKMAKISIPVICHTSQKINTLI